MLNMDNFLKEVEYALEVLDNHSNSSSKDEVLSADEKKQSQRVMRVNHMGEVCAQALYRGQAFTTEETSTKELILKMCSEERDHLGMCGDRIGELSGRTSYFNLLWYASSFMLGAYVGRLTKEKSLGFIYETEEQVEKHLDQYTDKLPTNDKKSRDILLEIKKDETKHKETAREFGSTELSDQTRNFMSLSSRVMKKLSFYF